KLANRSGLLKALAEAREELFIMLLLWCAAAGLLIGEDNPGWDLCFWVLVLQVQSLPYLAALVMALLSSLPARMPADTLATEGGCRAPRRPASFRIPAAPFRLARDA